jgi:AAA domain
MNTMNAATLMDQEFSATKFALPGLIPEGLTLLVGKSKLGKSWLVLQIMLAIANGTEVLSIPTEKGSVLYAALEDSPKRLQSRLELLLGDGQAPTGLEFITAMRRLDAGGLIDLTAWLDEHSDARLIVLDTLARVRPISRQTSGVYDQDTAALAPLQHLALERGVAILVVHHTRKAAAEDAVDAVNGSTGLAGVSDAILVLQRARGEADAKLHVTGRDIEEREVGLRFDSTSGVWTLTGSGKEFQVITPERRAVMNLLANSQPITPKVIAETLGKTSGSIRKLLVGMRSANLARRLADGRYTVVAAVTPVTQTNKPVQDEAEPKNITKVTLEDGGNTADIKTDTPLPTQADVTDTSTNKSLDAGTRASRTVTGVTANQALETDAELEQHAAELANQLDDENGRSITSCLHRLRDPKLTIHLRTDLLDELRFLVLTAKPSDARVQTQPLGVPQT